MRLEARNVSRHFGAGAGLQPTSLSVGPGEFLAVVGPSGVGKTTLLSILGGLMSPDSGTVCVNGDTISRRMLMAHVAWVPQGSNALPSRSLVANVMLSPLARGEPLDVAEPAALHALNVLGLSDRSQFLAREVSGGELQRLALARTLCTERSFVLADEPTGNLDAAATTSVVDAICAMRDNSRTILVATHDRTVWERADRVVKLGLQ